MRVRSGEGGPITVSAMNSAMLFTLVIGKITPSAVGTVAGEEAGSQSGQQMFVAPLLCDDALEVGAWDELEYLTEHAA